MIVHEYCDKRDLNYVSRRFDLLIVGGGMSGVCCAITAARQGVQVGLVQDRPVLGGNASSEVRIWVLGATSHMGNNNRWSREGGVIDEILVENLHRNKEGNPHIFDMVLIDKVLNEPNISLFLNTIVYDVEKRDARNLSGVRAFNPQNSTMYHFEASLFADCSGDGIVAYQAGASFRMGAEDAEHYNEAFVPDKEKYGELLGHSIVFYTKETTAPVRYVAPDFALKSDEVETLIPKVKNPNYFNVNQHGCKFWWLEYGGRLDTVHQTEQIKYELWRVVYGVWDYIKNSGKYPQTANQTLEWVGAIPGKRESRRFVGYYTLTQDDVIAQNEHYDAVAYGGWSIDMHPSDAVYSPMNGCNQWHSKGIYQIPYRSLLSKDIDNLFIGGRIMSASHVAYGSSRVMCTSSHGAQAIAMAAVLSLKKEVLPAAFIAPEAITELQQMLINSGQFIPSVGLADRENLLHRSRISLSGELRLHEIPFDGDWFALDYPAAQLMPAPASMPAVTFEVNATEDTEFTVQLRRSSKPVNFTPDVIMEECKVRVQQGISRPVVRFAQSHEEGGFVFFCMMSNPSVSVRRSKMLLSSFTSVFNYINPAVSNYGKQDPPPGIGVEAFEFWCPQRRPKGANFAFAFDKPVALFGADNLLNSYYRPSIGANCWIASPDDPRPEVTLSFDTPVVVSSIRLFFDTDYDHAMENVQMGHYDNEIPHCVRNYAVYDESDRLLYRKTGNYTSVNDVILPAPALLTRLRIVLEHPSPHTPAALFGLIIK